MITSFFEPGAAFDPTAFDPLQAFAKSKARADSGDGTSKTVAATEDQLSDKNTFLLLLVAQLRYQDPSAPADGLQFITQLAQFTTLEQQVQMREDLSAIRALLAGASSSAAGK